MNEKSNDFVHSSWNWTRTVDRGGASNKPTNKQTTH